MSDRGQVVNEYRVACAKAKNQAEQLRRRIEAIHDEKMGLRRRVDALEEEGAKLLTEAQSIERLAELLDLAARQEETPTPRLAASEPRPV